MKNIIASLLIGFFAFPIAPAHAALSESDRAQITIRQRLSNPGFEASSAGWVASTSAHLSIITSGVGSGNASAQWAPTASSETLASGYVTIASGDGLSGANGVASCRIKSVSGSNAPKIEAFDGTNKLVSQAVTLSSAGYMRTSANFIFPASGTVRLQFTSVGAQTVAIDDCYLGLADGYNFAQVSQAYDFGTLLYAPTSGCQWTVTQTTYAGDYAAQASCPTPTVTGSVSAPATKIPAWSASTMAPGVYSMDFSFNLNLAAAGQYASCRIVDESGNQIEDVAIINSNMATANLGMLQRITGNVTYSTAQSGKTFKVQCKASSGAAVIYSDTTASSIFDAQFSVKVKFFPAKSQTAYGANQQLLPTVQKFTSGSGTYTTPAGVSWIRVRMVGGGGGGGGGGTSAVTGTAGTASTFGTLTANGGNAGISAGGPSATGTIGAGWSTGSVVPSNGGAAGGNSTGAGTYPIGGIGGGSGIFGGGGASASTNTGTAGTANSGGGGAGAGSPTQGHLGGGGGSGGGGIDVISSGVPLATYSYAVGGGGAGGVGSDTTGSAGGSGVIEVTEYYGSQPYPLFVGSLTSPSSGQEYGTHARFTCGSSGSTVGSQGGSWLTIANGAGTGACTLTFSGFSGEPGCSLGLVGPASTAASSCTFDAAPTSTGVAVSRVRGGASENGQCEITCMGPR